jgi:hypothetical protein
MMPPKIAPINYNTATREEKRIIYRFIKTVYETATPRDVISGLHRAATDYTGKKVAVLTDLKKVMELNPAN